MGADGVSPFVLKKCAKGMMKPLCLIFRKSLLNNELPREWKDANVTGLFKKGCKSIAVNYRPVSLTSIPCKILEGFIRDHMITHMVVNQLIAPEQHGFVPKKSCTTNLLETVDFVSQAMHNGDSVDLIELDFEKAFDTVPHRKLMVKTRAFGFHDQILNWIAEFLKNRRQRVVLGEEVTEWKQVLSGVPQGSVLGPLLFVIFINDMPRKITNPSKLYADDSKILSVIKSDLDAAVLQDDLYSICEWCDVWQAKFNDIKCKVLHFGKKNPKFQYKLKIKDTESWHILEESDCERDLGIMLTSNLKWGKQISNAAGRANSILGRIKNSFSYFDVEMASLVYTVFVRPHLEFAVPVWSPYSECDIKKLESVQHRATRMVKGIKKMKYEQRLKVYGITDLKTRRERGDLIQFYKYVNKCEDIRLVEDIKFGQDKVTYMDQHLHEVYVKG